MADNDKEKSPPEPTQDDNDKVVFTPEQQAAIDKIVGGARTKARDQAQAEFEAAQAKATKEADDAAQAKQLLDDKKYTEIITQRDATIAELEPALKLATESANEAISKMSKVVKDVLDKLLDELGEAAKTAVDNLPGKPGLLEQLNWLTANEELFKTKEPPPPGTPPLKGAGNSQAKDKVAAPNIRF